VLPRSPLNQYSISDKILWQKFCSPNQANWSLCRSCGTQRAAKTSIKLTTSSWVNGKVEKANFFKVGCELKGGSLKNERILKFSENWDISAAVFGRGGSYVHADTVPKICKCPWWDSLSHTACNYEKRCVHKYLCLKTKSGYGRFTKRGYVPHGYGRAHR